MSNNSSMLKHGSIFVFHPPPPPEDKAVLLLQPRILILKDAKNFRETFFRGVELRASLCKILISSFAHRMDFAHNFSVDFF